MVVGALVNRLECFFYSLCGRAGGTCLLCVFVVGSSRPESIPLPTETCIVGVLWLSQSS